MSSPSPAVPPVERHIVAAAASVTSVRDGRDLVELVAMSVLDADVIVVDRGMLEDICGRELDQRDLDAVRTSIDLKAVATQAVTRALTAALSGVAQPT